MKEELGDDSLLSPNHLSTAAIFVRIGRTTMECLRSVGKSLAQHLLSLEPRYERDGVEGLCEPKSHAVHNPHTIDPEIERRIIELRREHSDWGKEADSPNKTINIDLCEKSPEKGEEDAVATKDSGLGIFSQEKLSYDEKMDAYVLMGNNKDKGDKQEDSKKTNIEEMGRKAETKREEEELRAWRRRIRIERRKEDEEWRKYREDSTGVLSMLLSFTKII